jgi:hypothetical protein
MVYDLRFTVQSVRTFVLGFGVTFEGINARVRG